MAADLAVVWRDLPLRSCYAYWALVAFFVMGPLQVALPVLASERLHGAAALGLLMGAHGAGTLLGMLLSGMGSAWLHRRFGATLLAVDAVVAVLMMALGQMLRHLSVGELFCGGGALLLAAAVAAALFSTIPGIAEAKTI